MCCCFAFGGDTMVYTDESTAIINAGNYSVFYELEDEDKAKIEEIGSLIKIIRPSCPRILCPCCFGNKLVVNRVKTLYPDAKIKMFLGSVMQVSVTPNFKNKTEQRIGIAGGVYSVHRVGDGFATVLVSPEEHQELMTVKSILTSQCWCTLRRSLHADRIGDGGTDCIWQCCYDPCAKDREKEIKESCKVIKFVAATSKGKTIGAVTFMVQGAGLVFIPGASPFDDNLRGAVESNKKYAVNASADVGNAMMDSDDVRSGVRLMFNAASEKDKAEYLKLYPWLKE